MVDLDNAVIVDVETTAPICQAEVNAALDMVDRVQDRFGLYPERFVGDGAYGNAETLGWLFYEKGIEPHVPVLDKLAREDQTFSRADFKFDHRGDRYLCPGGRELLPSRRQFQTIRPKAKDDETVRYRAAKSDCDACELKFRCCPKTPTRHVTRSIHEGARDMARDIAETDAFVAARRARRKVEMLFAHMKKIMGLSRLRLRGPNGAKRRVHPRRHRPEPPQDGQAPSRTGVKGGRLPLFVEALCCAATRCFSAEFPHCCRSLHRLGLRVGRGLDRGRSRPPAKTH